MKTLSKIAQAGRRFLNRLTAPKQRRSYREIASIGGQNNDWILNGVGIDADLWQNIFALRQRSRDLFRSDSYVKKFAAELTANVFGSQGIQLRMQIRETEPRTPGAVEMRHLESRYRLRQQLLASRHREQGKDPATAPKTPPKALLKPGDPDVYANQLIQDSWKDWQRKEFCGVTGKLTYQQIRELRLISAARDGDVFIRLIRDPKVNKYGFTLQLINAEWCDYYYNAIAPNGHEIRMGIELDEWKKPVAYYFIRRQPGDWQFSVPGAFAFTNGKLYERVPAEQIIHYCRFEDTDQARSAPWIVAAITKLRHLDKYEEAEVISARAEACKGGHYTSTIIPEGGYTYDPVDPTSGNVIDDLEPGQWKPLPFGVEAKAHNPTHPNGNFGGFRKAILQGVAAGLGCSYNILANDLEGVNYSSLRGGMLDEREMWMSLQEWDISAAELPIFEAWLEMALLTQAIPLPLAKFEKFNKPHFQGRRWAWVDPLKDANADAVMCREFFSSRTQINAENGQDFFQIAEEQAIEKMILKELGLDLPSPNTGTPAKEQPDGDEEPAPTKKPTQQPPEQKDDEDEND